ncbi:MAG TPA: amidohydrolase family protein [Acidimicrobiia bacterium]|jgi:N-acetylglucosamine-6-phosphate deacetylase
MTTVVGANGWVRFDDYGIVAAGPDRASRPPDAFVDDLGDEVVLLPGFVDLQVNGVGAVDFATAADEHAIAAALDDLTRHGTTACLPTIVTAPLDAYDEMIDRIRRARDLPDANQRCAILGVHLEGPFLGGAPGAHPKDLLRTVELDWLERLLDRHGDLVRMITLAPEADPGFAAIRMLAERGIVVALGHSSCSYDEAIAAADAGAQVVTHLFNGMRPMHHRDAGLAEAALVDPRLTPTLIADLHHVRAPSLQLALNAKERVALVSDAVAPGAGTSGGLEVVEHDGAVYLADGTLAGSVITLADAVRNVLSLGIDAERVSALASGNACALLDDHSRGELTPGRRADVVAIDPARGPGTPGGSVVGVWVGGVEGAR